MVRVLILVHQAVEFLNDKVQYMDGRSLQSLRHLGLKYSYNSQFNFLRDCIFFINFVMDQSTLL